MKLLTPVVYRKTCYKEKCMCKPYCPSHDFPFLFRSPPPPPLSCSNGCPTELRPAHMRHFVPPAVILCFIVCLLDADASGPRVTNIVVDIPQNRSVLREFFAAPLYISARVHWVGCDSIAVHRLCCASALLNGSIVASQKSGCSGVPCGCTSVKFVLPKEHISRGPLYLQVKVLDGDGSQLGQSGILRILVDDRVSDDLYWLRSANVGLNARAWENFCSSDIAACSVDNDLCAWPAREITEDVYGSDVSKFSVVKGTNAASPARSLHVPRLNANATAALWELLESELSGECDQICRAGTAGDGGWNYCSDQFLTERKHMCDVFSFGVELNWSFELVAAVELGCEVHAFDPSVNLPRSLGPNVTFWPMGLWGSRKTEPAGHGLKGACSNRRGQRCEPWMAFYDNVEGFMKRLGKHRLDILKIDCEGCEWVVFQDWHSRMINLDQEARRKMLPFTQLLLELHLEHASVQSIDSMVYVLREGGFRLFNRRLNPGAVLRRRRGWGAGGGAHLWWELAFVKRW